LPEAELPYTYESKNFDDFKKKIDFKKTIIGGIWHNSDGNLYNSMVNFAFEGIYNKVHLVPFGEFTPFISSLRNLISFFDMPMSDVTSGNYNQDPILVSSNPVIKAAPLICFDIAFGNTVRKSNISSLFMINISNDTWFGNSIGPHQHLDIARVRSIENNRWMIRATNDGFSAIIDNNGTIVDKLDKGVSGVLNSSIKLEETRTIYSKYGYYLPYLLALSILIFSVIINICSRKFF
jgi:apolipoprotein N-acyltransferase